MVEFWTIISGVGGALAAIGVVWERYDTLRSRPKAALRLHRVEPVTMPKDIRPKWMGQGDHWGHIGNFGSGTAKSISIDGVGCTAEQLPDEPRDLPLGQTLKISIDADPEVLKDAFIYVSWVDEGKSSKEKRITWFPVCAEGPLGQVRERQAEWNAIQRAVARHTTAPQPSPLSFARGQIAAVPSESGLPVSQFAAPWKPSRLRMRIAKLFRVAPEETDSVQRALLSFLKKRGLPTDGLFPE